MKIPKLVAIVGFNVCTSVFVGLSAYGIMLYMGGEAGFESLSMRSALYSGLAIAASIAGIAWFGIQWDRCKIADARRAAAAAGPAPPERPSRSRKKRRR